VESTPKKPFPLKKFTLIAASCTAVGYLLVFLPFFFNGYLLLFGLLLSIGGEFSLLAALIVAMRRSSFLARMRAKSINAYKRSWKPTLIGGTVFWLLGLATALLPIPHEFGIFSGSLSGTGLVALLLGALFVALWVSFYFIYFFDKIPTQNPVLKSVIVSFLGLLIIGFLGIFLNLKNPASFYLYDLAVNGPRTLALGVAVGYSYQRFELKQIPLKV
jgi:hypothetical protein